MSSDINEEVNHRKRRRNRMRVSCLNCYASKRKCDRKRPCTRCVQHGLTGLCVYELDDPDTRDPTLDETTHLRNRIAELESVIREINNRPHPRWFAANGVEHIPELVATRRPSVSNSSAGTGGSPSQAQKTPKSRYGSARNSTTPNDNYAKVGTKRKHEETSENATLSLTDAAFKKSRHTGDDLNDGSDDDSDDMSVTGREAYGSDNSDCTDEDDDGDDEDYEEYKSRSRPKARPRHVPAKQTQTVANAYSRGNDAKSTHNRSHNMSSGTLFKTAGTIPSQRSTSTSTSTSRSISISSAKPLSAPFSPTPLEASNRSGPQSGLGLIFDAPPTESDHKIDVDDNSSSSPSKRYSLRADVEWDDQGGDHDKGSGTGSFTSSASSLRSKALVNNSSRLESRSTSSASVSTQFSCQKKFSKENSGGVYNIVRHGRYIDTGVQTLETPPTGNFVHTATCSPSCSCLSELEVRNEVTFLVAILGDISNVLKAAHRGVSEPRERRSTVITHNRCELFRRIVELDEYFSNSSNERELNVVALSAIDDIRDSSGFVPGDRLSMGGQSNPSNKSPVASSHSKNSSKLSKTHHRQPPESGHQGRKRRSRTWSSESRNSTTPSDTAVETTNSRISSATVTYLPAPTPASILESSLSQETPAQTDTLASVLADTLMNTSTTNATDTIKNRNSDVLVTEARGPPRFLRTPDPTPTIPSTPTFSPSSPILRPTNSAIRRPDADFLPLYSYAAVGCGENHDDAERGMVSAHHRHHHHHGKVAAGLEHVNVNVTIPTVVDSAAAVANNHVVSVESSSLNEDTNTIAMDANNLNVNMGIDMDVDAEGEPAPESGYQYAYLEDGYRYEYVCIDDA